MLVFDNKVFYGTKEPYILFLDIHVIAVVRENVFVSELTS